VATNADIPEFDAYFAGGFDEETSPLGAKGLGELTAAASAAPAIANAVCHATTGVFETCRSPRRGCRERYRATEY
jgi:CO/xanthine dehydrogenase Mo-binding subunit